MPLSRDIAGTPQTWARDLAAAAVVGLFLGLIGPFGSYLNDAPLQRIAYWVATICAGAVIIGLTLRVALRLGDALGLPAWFSLPAGVLAATAPVAWLSAAVSLHVWPRYVAKLTATDWYLETLVIVVPVVAGRVLLERWTAPPRVPATPRSVAPAADRAFPERLTPRVGRDVLALQMEDHYVRAHTSAGSELVLIPMRQAIAELADVEGLRTHRSWWVARAAVEGVREEGRNVRLRLKGGLEAPVARANVAAVRAAGWLDG